MHRHGWDEEGFGEYDDDMDRKSRIVRVGMKYLLLRTRLVKKIQKRKAITCGTCCRLVLCVYMYVVRASCQPHVSMGKMFQ